MLGSQGQQRWKSIQDIQSFYAERITCLGMWPDFKVGIAGWEGKPVRLGTGFDGQVSPTGLIGRSFGQMVMEITCYMTWKTGTRAMFWMTMGLGSQSKMRLWTLPFGGLIEETGPASQCARRLGATSARPHISLIALPPGLGLLRSSACGTQMCPDHCSSKLRTS
jgi:hypothetical protein